MSNIKWFHLELKEGLESKNVTIKGFCKDHNLNYMKMLKVLKGDCMLQKACFDKVIGSKIFSKEEIKSLEHSFRHVNLKMEDRQKINTIENILKSLYETITEHSKSKSGCLERKEDRSSMKIGLQINDHIYKSYTSALKEAFVKGKSDYKIILLLPEIPGLIHEIYHTIKALMSCLDKRITWQIQCMVHMTDSSTCKESQMIHLSKYIKLLTLSPNIRVHTIADCEKSKVKYGVYFQDRTLFFNTRDQDLILEYRDHQSVFNDLNYKNNDLFKTYYDGPSFNSYLCNLMDTKAYVNNHHFGIRSYLSAVSIGETFKKTHGGHRESPSFPILERYHKKEAEILTNNKVKMVQFICESGIDTLLREGYIADYPSGVHPIDEVSRLALIYDALEKTSKGYHLRLLPMDVGQADPWIRLIQFFEMHQKANQWILARSNPPKEGIDIRKVLNKGDVYALVVEDSKLVESFELFCSHIIWHKTMTTQGSIKQIKKMVMKYYGHHKDLKIQALKDKIISF